jgi:hypothetical protein
MPILLNASTGAIVCNASTGAVVLTSNTSGCSCCGSSLPSCPDCNITGFNVTTSGIVACPDLSAAGVSSADLNGSWFVPFLSSSDDGEGHTICRYKLQIATAVISGSSYPVTITVGFDLFLSEFSGTIQAPDVPDGYNIQFSGSSSTGATCTDSYSISNSSLGCFPLGSFDYRAKDGTLDATPVT